MYPSSGCWTSARETSSPTQPRGLWVPTGRLEVCCGAKGAAVAVETGKIGTRPASTQHQPSPTITSSMMSPSSSPWSHWKYFKVLTVSPPGDPFVSLFGYCMFAVFRERSAEDPGVDEPSEVSALFQRAAPKWMMPLPDSDATHANATQSTENT